MKESQNTTKNISEINQRNLSLLDVSQLTAFLNIFKGVSNSKAKQVVKDLSRELSTRKTEEVEEASIKDIVKSVKAATKKIGGIIDKVMDDAEFQKAYAKYIDNPNDKNRLKKIQDYTNGMMGDMSESTTLREERLKKVCSVVLGEDFDQDFIYEDADFSKPSIIKEAYKKFIYENRAIVNNPKGIKRFIRQAEKKFPQYKGEIEQLEDDEIIFPNDPKLINFFKGAREVKFVLKDSVEIKEAKKVIASVELWNGKKMKKSFKDQSAAEKFIKKTQDEEDVRGYNMYAEGLEEGKIPSSNIARFSNPKAAKQAASKQKYKTQIFMGDDDKFWVPSTNKEAGQLKKAGYEVYESADLEEAVKFWTVTITKKAGKLFKGQTVDVKASNSAEAIKKGLKQMKANPNTVPSGSVDAVLGESIEESNKDKYMWGDINKALSSAGLNPRIIMNVLSKLKGKALKESRTVDLEKANVLTYDEYDEVQNFKNFNKKDWKRNAIQRKYIRKKKV